MWNLPDSARKEGHPERRIGPTLERDFRFTERNPKRIQRALGVLLANWLRDVLDCLADDLVTAHKRTFQCVIVQKRFLGETL